MDHILNRYLNKLVTASLDTFFGRTSEFYDDRRQILEEKLPEGGGLAIDHILGKRFAPSTAQEWLTLYLNPVVNQQPKKTKKDNSSHDELTRAARQILVVYLRYDLMNSQTKVPANIIDKISSIPSQFIFPYQIIRMAAGLWAIDNADPSLALKSLNLPSLDLGNYLQQDNAVTNLVKLILSTMTIDQNHKVALQLCNMRLHENWDENYYVQHVLHVREALNLVSVANSTCDANSQTSGRRTPSRLRNREIKKTASFEDSPARNTRLRKGKIK